MIKKAFKFSEKKIPLINWIELFNELVKPNEDISDSVFTGTFAKLRKPKTYDQIKYFHCDDFLLRFTDALSEACTYGKAPKDKVKRKEWGKYQIKMHPEIAYYEQKYNVFTKETQNEPLSFADIDKDEMSRIISWCMDKAENFLGVVLQSSEEYKRINGLK